MGKEDQIILAVERDKLFIGDHFIGFKPAAEADFESRILEHGEYGRRGDLEEDPNRKQPIGYCCIANPETGRVFAYQRAANEQDADYRLTSKWSWGVGGHIEQDAESTAQNPIKDGMEREIGEEIEIQGKVYNIQVLGYVNDEDDIGKVHIGVLYVAKTNATVVAPKSPEIARGELVPIAELERLCADKQAKVETWSRFAVEPLKQMLEQ
jgi:predicted NUDIX family phosphoesterase